MCCQDDKDGWKTKNKSKEDEGNNRDGFLDEGDDDYPGKNQFQINSSPTTGKRWEGENIPK